MYLTTEGDLRYKKDAVQAQ